jgi:polar amino acid transport system substrate-binding protein
MKRSTMIFVLAIFVFTVALSACAPKQEAIRVATDATWPPFEILDEETKEIVGFDIDMMTAIAEKEGMDIEFENVPWDALLAGMAQCQYDVAISAMTITEDRAKEFAFSNPYFEAGQIVTVAVDDTEINSKDDLVGKKVGAQLGTTGAIEIENMEGVELAAYDTVDLAFLDVMSGQIDAVIADNPLALGFVGQYPDKLKSVGPVFTDENYGIAVCKEKTDLVEQINSGLAAIQADGTVDELVQKWLAAGE